MFTLDKRGEAFESTYISDSYLFFTTKLFPDAILVTTNSIVLHFSSTKASGSGAFLVLAKSLITTCLALYFVPVSFPASAHISAQLRSSCNHILRLPSTYAILPP